ncbi:sulfatase-like hydrolase/transferase [Fusobacterium varium]|uniref:sulfatase-like hydrolase/transferase n=1 Tax=Fusobacterium varium TaxID=856 RepID=UPI00242C6B66|nr:sulfatase-like hydrolase/transferase [Fusobacterium varium]
MKILFIFCDMLRGNTILKEDDIFFKNYLKKWLENDFFGTIFTNSYTGTPDTARGLGMIFSGIYPKKNGCSYKINYPKYYLKKNKFTLYKLLKEKKFNIKFYIDEKTDKLGNFPRGLEIDEKKIISNQDEIIEDLKIELDKNKNFFSFININDYHTTVDDYGANKFSDFLAKKRITNFFKFFFKNIDKDIFDYIFIFSDHGNKYDRLFKKENRLLFLNDDRTNITMIMRKKNDNILKKDNSLRTLVDIVPTISEILELKTNKLDGISLLNTNKEIINSRRIIIEDYDDFYSIYNFKIWGYIDYKNIYVTDLKNNILINKNKKEEVKENFLIPELIKKEIQMGSIEYKRKERMNNLENYFKRNVYILEYRYISGKKRKLFYKIIKNFFKKVILWK